MNRVLYGGTVLKYIRIDRLHHPLSQYLFNRNLDRGFQTDQMEEVNREGGPVDIIIYLPRIDFFGNR